MTAPVYRNIEGANTFLGLSFPLETVFVFGAWFGCLALLSAGKALIGIATIYGCVRLVGHGRPPGFVQHWVAWRIRQMVSGGWLTAATRAPVPRFPFAPYAVGPLQSRRVKGERSTVNVLPLRGGA